MREAIFPRTLGATLLAFLLVAVSLVVVMPPALADGGDYSVDFTAAAPFTYDHTTGGGAFDDRTIGKSADVVESLEGGDFACGELVTYLTHVTVDDLSVGSDPHTVETIELVYEFGVRATNGLEAGHVEVMNVAINYGPVGGEGPGGTDAGINHIAGSVATLVYQEYDDGTLPNGSYPDANPAADDLIAAVQISDLESFETVVLRIDVLLGCGTDVDGQANIQARVSDADVVLADGIPFADSINTGAQTVPFKNIGAIAQDPPAITVEKLNDANDDAAFSDDETVPVAGDEVTFQVTVANTGTADVLIDSLSDDIHDVAGSSCAALIGTTLGSGQSTTCTFVGASPLSENATEVDTVTVVVSNDSGTDTQIDTSTVRTPDVPSSISLVKTADPVSVDEPGDSVTFSVTVTNTSLVDTVTINSLIDNVHGDLNGEGDCAVPFDLAPGASYDCSFIAAVNGVPGYVEVDTVTATGVDDDGDPVTASDDATVTITGVGSSISLVKTADPVSVDEPGDSVTFSVTVTNTSLVDTVTINSLIDNVHGDLNGEGDCAVPFDLAPGASYDCSFIAAVNGVPGYVEVDTVTATGVDDDGDPVTASDDATVTITGVGSSISLVKTADPVSVDEPGDSVTFSVTVTNTSLVDTVTINSLIDNVHGDLNGEGDCAVPFDLAPGASYDCSFIAAVNGVPGYVEVDTVTATGVDDDGDPVTASDDATVTITGVGSSISLVKTADPVSVDEPGDSVTFSVTVTNTSLVDTVTINSLIDNVHGDLNGEGDCAVPFDLAPGASYDCSFIAAVNGVPGYVEVDTVTATGVDDDGDPVTASDDATVTITGVGSSISLVKTADPVSVDEPGDSVTFSVTVTNTSLVDTVTINSLIDNVHGDLNGEGDCAVPFDLAPGASYDCSFIAAVNGVPGYVEVDTVTATGVDDDGDPVTASDDATVTIADVPSDIEVTKTASPSSLTAPGGTVTFSVEVANLSLTDTVTITSLVDDIHGDLDGKGTCVVPFDLAPAGSEGDTYSCSFTAFVGSTETDVVTAAGFDDDKNAVSDSDDATVTVRSDPSPPALGSIGNLVWEDRNANGIQDPGEPGVAGVVVELFDADTDTLLGIRVTDANGNYLFDDLEPGDYYLVFTLPSADDDFIPPNMGSDSALDSDPDNVTLIGRTPVITVLGNVIDDSWDAGVAFVAVGGVQITTTTPETLPFTGASLGESGMAGIALALLALGGVALLSVRRREEQKEVVATGWSGRLWDVE